MNTVWRIVKTGVPPIPAFQGDFGDDFGDDFGTFTPAELHPIGTIWRVAGQQDFIIPPFLLSGNIAGGAVLTGNPTIELVDLHLVGNIGAGAIIGGNLSIVVAPNNLVGNIPGVGALAGALSIVSSPVLFTYDFIASPSLPTGLSLSRATIGTYVDTTGTRQTAAINVARFDSDWDGSAFTTRGMRVEEARLNGVSASENGVGQFANVTNCAWSGSAVTGADNSTLLQTITASAGAAFTDTSFGTSQGSGVNYFDVSFKKTNSNYVYIDHVMSGGNSYTAVFDLVNGTVTDSFVQGSFTGSASVRRLRNSIFRCGIVTNQGAGFLVIGLAPTATGNSFDSVGHVTGLSAAGTETVLVGSTQADGPGSTYHASHIVSSGGATARSADLVSATGTLATQLAGGPSVWEMEDLVTGTVSRTQFTNGAFTFPTGKRWRSFGVYPNGTNTAPYTTVGGPY